MSDTTASGSETSDQNDIIHDTFSDPPEEDLLIALDEISKDIVNIRDKNDWMIDLGVFQDLDMRFGPFSVDACSDPLGANSHVPFKFWSNKDSCLNHNWATHNVCNPPWSMIESNIHHYLQHIDECNLTLVVPNWTWAKWYPKVLKYFKIVEFYPAGSLLFTAPSHEEQGQRISLGPTRWQVLICQGKRSIDVETTVIDNEWDLPYFPPSAVPDQLQINHSIQLGNQAQSNLTEDQKQILNMTITEFQDVIAWTDDHIGKTFVEAAPIDTGDAAPIKQRAYKRSPAEERIVQEEVNNWLRLGIVEKSKSLWSSPIVLVPKKAIDPNDPMEEKRYRPCIDFRKVNAVTKSDSYPLPNMQEALDSLGQSTYFSVIDLRSAFLQLP
jgi:hypothetical protein